MPSKKYSQHLCVYCQVQRSTATADHIFARQFFLVSDRDSLPKAPCCKACGTQKSIDEHYLTAVLPFGGRHPGARANLTSMVPKRLAQNRRLRERLASGLQISITGKPMLIPLETDRIQRLFERVTVGLLWHSWRIYLPTAYSVQSALLSPTGEEFFNRLFSLHAQGRVSVNLGDGTVEYTGAQSPADPAFSIWRIGCTADCR
ncbi:HNH endonuclease [Ensifer sp. ENS04]|uniref:HNH endonuclease n=1 Tax=Ensifer sp. ENS04 TaxID=2769281 RepID=UPI001786F601|nr:HNH endonuclease [Ensifer sp. ENS04]MBD9544521.1 HNH endonuclease [Ensifer sp. ENS04]